jgi:predicted DCC family thiol-disulfide oxidoreductase YuxK
MNYILYDSKCKFCTATVKYFLSKNLKKNLLILPVQDKEARAILRNLGISFVDLNTIYFVEDGHVFVRSQAIFHICNHLKFPWKMVSVFSFLPKKATDFIYKWIARNRYRL